MTLWDSLFGHLSQPIAQVLLTRNDIADVRAIKSFWLPLKHHSSLEVVLGPSLVPSLTNLIWKTDNHLFFYCLKQRTRYLNAQNTVNQLLDMGVIPIVNENDTLAVSEIKFGDNDTLSAITAAMIHADLLFLMTDVDCLYDKNPRTNPDAKPIEIVDDFALLEADGKL